MHRVVIVGGGFAGLHAARHLGHLDVSVTLIDTRNFHLFQPLLYQVATASLSPANIAAPLRTILKNQKNTTVLMGQVIDIDVEKREVVLEDARVPYDSLLLATGARHQYFGRDDWEKYAPGLKTIEDALNIRQRILTAFELAERETDPKAIERLLNFVIIGSGPTGVELAGALCEVSRQTLTREFRNIDPSKAHIIILERQNRVLPMYPDELSKNAGDTLRALGAELRPGVVVTDITKQGVEIEVNGGKEFIPTANVIWAAGVLASPMGKKLAEKTGAELDPAGRVKVDDHLHLPGHPEIFVLGDLAHCPGPKGTPLPAVAPVATQMGRYAAQVIEDQLANRTTPPFNYHDLGSMATIGRSNAVAQLPWFKLSGFLAWVAWLFIHLMNLIEFQNRVLVLMQWSWNYVTWRRAARLITEVPTIQCEHEKG